MLVKERKAQMRVAKVHPREGIHEAAISDIAQQHGISVEALNGCRRLKQIKETSLVSLAAAVKRRLIRL